VEAVRRRHLLADADYDVSILLAGPASLFFHVIHHVVYQWE
jgi:hypothetical protein